MSVLPDWKVESDVRIVPLAEGVHRPGVISYGVTSFGYDARAGRTWRVFNGNWQGHNGNAVVDPKDFDPAILAPLVVHVSRDGHEFVVVPPRSVVLGETVEEFTIPRDVLCIVVGKSTYARVGLLVNVTPGEPEWSGRWTVEVTNPTPLPVRLYCGEGVMQCVFFRGEGPCRVSYADKRGKYQNQPGLTLPVVH